MSEPLAAGKADALFVKERTVAEPIDIDARTQLIALMRTHGSALYGHCIRIVGNRDVAADVLQQAFEQAFRDVANIREPSFVKAWLFSIATHRSLDALKKARTMRHHFVEDDAASERAPAASTPEKLLVQHELSHILKQCLKELPPATRAAVLLRFLDGASYPEIARLFASEGGEYSEPNTIEARVRRALPALRECLETKGARP